MDLAEPKYKLLEQMLFIQQTKIEYLLLLIKHKPILSPKENPQNIENSNFSWLK